MENYYIYFSITAALLCFGATWWLRKICVANKIALSPIRERDVHKTLIPRIGGLSIWVVFWSIIFSILLIKPELISFSDKKILGIDENLLGLFLAGVVWLVVGLWDDIKDLKPWKKLVWQFVCGFLIVIFGIKIWWITNPFGGPLFILGNWNYLVVPLWIVAMMNVFNWFDGIDGLTPSISTISLAILFFLAINPAVNQPTTALFCAILGAVVLGFLPLNWNPAKIFLGDVGSGFLGMAIATFAIMSGAKLATAILVLGLPIIDFIVVVLGRLLAKKSIFTGDQTHLHHRFLRAGFSVKQTVVIISLISLGFGIIALYSQTQGKMIAFLWLVGLMAIILVGLFILEKNHGRKN